MLQAASISDHLVEPQAEPNGPTRLRVAAVVTPPSSGGRYGEGRTLNLPAIAMVAAVHVVLIAGVMLIRPAFTERHEKRLRMVEVNLETPPPPPEQKKAPQPAKLEAVKLEPVQVAAPPPPVQFSPAVIQIAPAPEVKLPAAPAAPPAPPVPAAVLAPIQVSDLGERIIGKPPRYPEESRKKREEGVVVLGLTIDTQGRVSDVSIIRSSGFSRLDEAARRAARSWRLAPIIRNGAPVWASGNFNFSLPFKLS